MTDYALPLEAFHKIENCRLEIKEGKTLRLQAPAVGGAILLKAGECPLQMWSEHHYLSADVYHQCHDVLVVLLSFTDQKGRNITVHYGVLPNVLTTLCLPLAALNGEKLFLDRYPGVMQSVLRGDAFVDRGTIRQFRIATVPSTGERSFDISNITLRDSVPDFTYASTTYIDELGQLAWKNWSGKIHNQQQLVHSLHGELLGFQQADYAVQVGANGQKEHAELKREPELIEEETPVQSSLELSEYGGWKSLRFAATGYFRTEYDGERWWFVDPQGYALFSTGMDCIHPATAMRVEGMEHLTPALPERNGEFAGAWTGEGYSFGIANLMSVFGTGWREKWKELTEYRMKAWGFNTIGNWSADDFIAYSSMPYVYPMSGFPETEHKIFRDFPDVFSSEYEEQAKAFAAQLLPFQNDSRLIGYFMRNEPHWAFVDGVNLTEQLLRSPHHYASKTAFIHWLMDKYATVGQWNAAWESSFHTFEDLYDPALAAAGMDSAAALQDFSAFNRIMIRRYVEVPSGYCRLVDPHHLNLGMRYAWVSNDEVLEGCELFDVFSINCYDMAPNHEQIQYISQRLNKPLMIGEFHFGAADAGMLAYGIRAVETQAERGQAYQYYVEQAAAIPELIGVHYFQLNDQPVLGRFDGENYGIGVVDVCQQPYQPFVEAMKAAHARMYEVRTGKLAPLQHWPKEIPRTGF